MRRPTERLGGSRSASAARRRIDDSGRKPALSLPLPLRLPQGSVECAVEVGAELGDPCGRGCPIGSHHNSATRRQQLQTMPHQVPQPPLYAVTHDRAPHCPRNHETDARGAVRVRGSPPQMENERGTASTPAAAYGRGELVAPSHPVRVGKHARRVLIWAVHGPASTSRQAAELVVNHTTLGRKAGPTLGPPSVDDRTACPRTHA